MDKYGRLAMTLGILSMLLGIQFLLGMYINLYISIPAGTHSFASYITENGIVAAHIFLAFIIVIIDFFAFFMAIHARIGNKYIFSILLSLISIVIAGVSGMLFVMGNQSDAYSFAMSFFFLLAFGFIGFGNSGTRKAKS